MGSVRNQTLWVDFISLTNIQEDVAAVVEAWGTVVGRGEGDETGGGGGERGEAKLDHVGGLEGVDSEFLV